LPNFKTPVRYRHQQSVGTVREFTPVQQFQQTLLDIRSGQGLSAYLATNEGKIRQTVTNTKS